jgi:hypothetical protein
VRSHLGGPDAGVSERWPYHRLIVVHNESRCL